MLTRFTFLFIASLAASTSAQAPLGPYPGQPAFEPRPFAELEVAVPQLHREQGDLLVRAQPDRPGLLLVGAAHPSGAVRELTNGARLELVPTEMVPFRTDAEGQASVELPLSVLRGNHLAQVLVFNGNRTEVAVNFPARSFAVESQAGSSLNLTAQSGPGYTMTAANAGAYGTLEEGCVEYCSSCGDDPDSANFDANCDGLDGNISEAIFVDPIGGSFSGAGTMDDPLLELQFAIDLAAATPGKNHVYASHGPVLGPIYLADGVSVWGGFDASDDWSRSPSNETYIFNISTVNSAEGYTALRGSNLFSPMTVGDLKVEAWGGGALLLVGGDNAIGVHLMNVSNLRLERITAIGAWSNFGNNGPSSGNSSSFYTGGSGGSGGTSSSLPGSGKTGGGSLCGLGGLGGLGGAPYFNGFTGVLGAIGLPGAFASPTSFGTPSISGSNLVITRTGNNGSNGCPGGAGGGGGGGGYAWPVGNGGKGGKGGSGGKYGYGGKGGFAGGCSVGALLIDADVTAVDCTFIGDHGGIGGFPGSSGSGTSGSAGSNGQILSGLPDGGKGGQGAAGGLGGFGSPGPSGHSYGLVHSSSSTVDLISTTLQATNPGLETPFFPAGIAGEAKLTKQL